MENNTPLSRVEDILQSTIDNTEYDKPPQSRVESLLIELKEVIEGGGGGGGSAYHPAGSVDYVSELPSPSADYLGYVYDITQAFTTTSDFKEGAGKRYPAGSNIAIVDVGTPESPSYKYDVLSGFIDTSNFVEKEEGKGLSTNDYTNTDKVKLASLENYDDTEIRAEIAEKADDADLAAVAKSGSYNDLADTPDIPSKTSDLTNDSHFVNETQMDEAIDSTDISSTISGINPSIIDAADGHVQNIKIKGATDSTTAASVGDAGWGSLKLGTQDWYYDSEDNKFYTSTPAESYNTPASSKQGGYNGYSTGYPVVTGIAYTEMPDKSIMLGPTQLSSSFRFVVKDTSFAGDISAFKSATKDITVFYPLGNPALGSPLVGITTNNGAGIGTSATLTTGMPLCSLSESLTDEVDMLAGVAKRCCGVDLGEVEWTYQAFDVPRFVGILPHICMPNEWLNFICNSSEYIADTSPLTGTNVDKTIMIYNITSTQCWVMIHDFDYMDATLFKNHVNGVKLVYGLATPYDLPLTSAEKFALLNLRTFENITNITCTDSPQMTVDYMLNTENGASVGQVVENMTGFINSLAFVWNTPEMHRMIFRGKYLGDHVTAAQLAAIRNGSFDDLYVGDYWIMGGVNWRIADINYWLHCGDTAFGKPHLVIVPNTCLYNAKMNDENITTGGYVGSKMYTENLNQAKTTINSLFVDMVLSHREYLVNAVSNGKASGRAWLDSTVELMNENMVYGHREFTPGCDGTTVPANYTIDKTQLALFALAPKFITNRANQWLRDVVSAASFAYVATDGYADSYRASVSVGVRPVFAIG